MEILHKVNDTLMFTEHFNYMVNYKAWIGSLQNKLNSCAAKTSNDLLSMINLHKSGYCVSHTETVSDATFFVPLPEPLPMNPQVFCPYTHWSWAKYNLKPSATIEPLSD